MPLSFGICTKPNSPTNGSQDLFIEIMLMNNTLVAFYFYYILIVFIPLYLLTCTLFSVALCLDPPAIVNGMRTFTGNSVGDTATYSCTTGFELIGDLTTMCTQIDVNSATFPAIPPPECRRECLMTITITVWNFCMPSLLWYIYKEQMPRKTQLICLRNFSTHAHGLHTSGAFIHPFIY